MSNARTWTTRELSKALSLPTPTLADWIRQGLLVPLGIEKGDTTVPRRWETLQVLGVDLMRRMMGCGIQSRDASDYAGRLIDNIEHLLETPSLEITVADIDAAPVGTITVDMTDSSHRFVTIFTDKNSPAYARNPIIGTPDKTGIEPVTILTIDWPLALKAAVRGLNHARLMG